MRVLLDTNIFISTIFFPSEQTGKLVKVLAAKHQINICDYVIKELNLVVERKFSNKQEDLQRFFDELPFRLVQTTNAVIPANLPDMRDTNDLPILAAAITNDIDIILTGDKDFLVLNIERPRIMTMTQFLETEPD